uniref:Uncharacterized protein n=1 Tax=Davidia involucrata TaxID=16924 RepID=A0A5B7C3T3_DAVIN
MEREDHSSIDVEDPDTPLVRSIRKMLDGLPPQSPECCIFRVPKNLRNVNAKAYTPQIVSIGPLHHGDKDLQAMEELKLRYLHAFLDRTEMNLEKCVKEIKVWEERARSFYSESIKLSSDEFVKMILVDSGFIIEVILRFHSPKWKLPEIIDVLADMILIENQLPFFVIESLYKLAFASHQQQDLHSLVGLSIKYFKYLLPLNYIPEMISSSEVKHFVDLIRMCLLRASRGSLKARTGMYMSIGNATELHHAGVKFMKSPSNCLLDMQFTGGLLEIPQLSVQDMTESLLRNLIVLELYCYRFDSYILDYVCFMDNLIDTPKDVDLLIQNEIIQCCLGVNFEVAALFNNLTRETTLLGGFYFSDLYGDLNAYCKIPWHNWKAILKRDYFSTPFRGASTVAAVILLVLTFLQTICSILSL